MLIERNEETTAILGRVEKMIGEFCYDDGEPNVEMQWKRRRIGELCLAINSPKKPLHRWVTMTTRTVKMTAGFKCDLKRERNIDWCKLYQYIYIN